MQVEADWTPELILEALTVRAASSISATGRLVQSLIEKGVSPTAIFAEQVQSDFLQISKHHAERFIMESFITGIKESSSQLDTNAVGHLRTLAKIYGLKCLGSDMCDLFECGYLGKEQGPLVEKALKENIKAIRPMALGLAEAVAPPDEFLLSAIGNKTTDPYETLMEWTKKYNPLNRQPLLPGFKEHIVPIMRAKL